MSDLVERFKILTNKQKNLAEKKIRLEEKYKSKKEELLKIVKEIKDMGYDPKNLSNILKQKEEEINNLLKKFENDLNNISEELYKIEGEQ